MSAADDGNGLGIFMLAVGGAVALVVFTVTMLLGLSLVGGVSSDLGSTDDPFNTTATPDPETGTAVSFADTWGNAEVMDVFQVRDSTNRSVELTGADDSYVQSRDSFTVASDDTWSVCTWAKVDSGAASENMTAVSANGRVLLQYNGSQSNWSAWYYDEGSRNSWRVNVSAPNQPASFSHVCAIHNGSHLSIHRNTTDGETVDTTSGSNIVDADTDSSNWNGQLDETRTFDTALNSSQRQALVDYPIGPLTNATRTARLTYDEGEGAVTQVYFANVAADVSNASWAGGLNGSQLEDGTDYTLDQGDGSITALDGGLIDGSPVVWIDYRYRPLSRVGDVSRALEPAFGLSGTIALVIPGVAVLGLLMGGLIGGIAVMRRVDFGDMPFGGRNRGNR